MVPNGKTCSRCKKFKSADEFYKQGDRLESSCKSCKRESRGQKIAPASTPKELIATNIESSTQNLPKPNQHYSYEREQLPEYDESIFYPEVAAMALGLTMDDLADITTFVRWHVDQKEKQERKDAK